MAMKGRVEPKNNNPYPVYLLSYLLLTTYIFIIDACPGHILESTKGILMKLGL